MNLQNLLTVKQFADRYPVFTENALRALIFNARFNGMEEHGVISRIGTKVLINEDNFVKWIETNPKTKGVAK